MNIAGCANCFLHGWKQVEDLRTLQRCSKCKLIEYCGKECQSEHWKRIHKAQCRYFADPVKAQKWGHNEEACTICLEAARVGKAQICRATNPKYECIFKEKFPPHMYHPHPFPVNGQPGHTYEKAIIVLWQLLKKFELTQPEVFRNCPGKLVKVFAELKMIRLNVWKARKISGKSEKIQEKTLSDCLSDLLLTIKGKVGINESMKDLVQIIELVYFMSKGVDYSDHLQILLNPLADLPADLHTIVSQALSNSTHYLTMANHVLDALAAQVVPYQDLLRIVCGGSLDKRCNFCSEKTTITFIATTGRQASHSAVVFNCLFMEIYHCENHNCVMKAYSMVKDFLQFVCAVITTVEERLVTKCDFCLKLPPSAAVHRCSRCLTVMYCSKTCRDQDVEIHKEFCKEETEERKKKFGSSGRRKEARDVVERKEKRMEEVMLERGTEYVKFAQESVEVLKKFKLKGASKKAKIYENELYKSSCNDAEKFKAEDDQPKERISAKNSLESYCFNMKTTLEDEHVKGKIEEEEKNSLESYCFNMKTTLEDEHVKRKIEEEEKKIILEKCEETIKWLDANQLAEVEEFNDKQKEVESVCNPIITKMYAAAVGDPEGMPEGMGGMPGMGGGATGAGSGAGPIIEEVD